MQRTQFWNLFALHGSKIIVLLSVFLLWPNWSNAQMNLPNHDSKRLHFGIGVGYNTSKFWLVHSDEFTFHDSIKVAESTRAPGFNFNIISNLHLTKKLDLRFLPGIIFGEKNLRYVELGPKNDTSVVKTIESIYLDLPLLLKYKSDRIFDNFRFYVVSGMRFDYDFASNSKKRRATDIVKVDRLDYAGEIGLGLEFYFPLFIFSPEIKFSYGLPDVFVETPNLRFSDVLDKLKSRAIVITLQFEG